MSFDMNPADDDPHAQCANEIHRLQDDNDTLRQQLDSLGKLASEQATARGEAEGRLMGSELAGVVDGWKQRAEAAESARDQFADECRRLREALANCVEQMEKNRPQHPTPPGFRAEFEESIKDARAELAPKPEAEERA